VTYPKEVLHKRIYKRLIERLDKEDMIGEVERLRSEGVSWKRLIGFGLEYKYIALYLRGEISYDEMVEKLFIAIKQFAKRQMTWLRRWEKQGAEIHWVKSKKEADKLVSEFL
jgi:tRNA dimethylallyltransferase